MQGAGHTVIAAEHAASQLAQVGCYAPGIDAQGMQAGPPQARADHPQDGLLGGHGAAIDGATGLIAAIRDLEPGDSTTITVVREGERIDLMVTLAERPED